MRVFLVVFFLAMNHVAAAQTARAQLKQFSQNLQTASVSFQQTVTGPNGEKIQSAQGQLQIKSPNLFRWEYSKPNAQLILADGKKIVVYEPDLQQATIKPQDALSQDNPLSALTKPSLLPQYFVVSDLPDKNGVSWLQLVPKNPSNSPFDKVWLGFNTTGLITMKLFDGLGQVSEFRFGKWQKNARIDTERFVFKIPKGVDVVE